MVLSTSEGGWSVRIPTDSMNQTRWLGGGRRERMREREEKWDVIDGVKMYDGVSIKRGREKTSLSWITGGGNEVVTLPDMPITMRV